MYICTQLDIHVVHISGTLYYLRDKTPKSSRFWWVSCDICPVLRQKKYHMVKSLISAASVTIAILNVLQPTHLDLFGYILGCQYVSIAMLHITLLLMHNMTRVTDSLQSQLVQVVWVPSLQSELV